MPNIAILAPSSVPFIIGGAEKFWWGLHKGLAEHSGAYAELIKLPCKEHSFWDIIHSYKMFYQLDVSHFDMVISTKYPAWMVSHPKHVLYMQHPLRGLYDTYHFTGLTETLPQVPTQLRDVMAQIRKERPNRDDVDSVFDMLRGMQEHKSLPMWLFTFPGPFIREIVHFFDRWALSPDNIASYAAISGTVKNRPGYFPPEASVKILHHPSDMTGFADEPGEYIFTASRLTNMKRLDLLVEAMRHVDVDIPLRIAGEGPELPRLLSLAGGDKRIEFLGYVPDSKLAEMYKKALFVPFVPYDEDYGLITIEAMQCAKPVVTTKDAGGVCEFVKNGISGYCTEPIPEELGAAMQRLASDPDHARELGANAQKLVSDITWKNTVTTLVGHARKTMIRKAAQGRRKVLVATTFSAASPISGGQQRVHHLCRALANEYFVQLVCLGGKKMEFAQSTQVTPLFHEVCLPWSVELTKREEELSALTGLQVGDIACMDTCANDSMLVDILKEYGEDSDFVVASHPYLYPALKNALPDVPLVYDAHNVEVDMKAAVLRDYADGEKFLQRVRDVEGACCTHARWILACSEYDARQFVKLYGLHSEKIIIIPNGFDPESVCFADMKTRNATRETLGYADVFTCFFMGSSHGPNLEAVERIKEMARQLPEIQFLIAGSVCFAPAVQNPPLPNVHYLGILSNKEKNILLRSANVALNPVESGSGTNLKTIEYLASGLETISTVFGIRGLDDLDGIHEGVRLCAVDEFVQTVSQAKKEPIAEEKLASAARNVRERFNWDAIMTALPARLYHSLTSTPARMVPHAL